MFGGLTDCYMDDFFELDLYTFEWTEIPYDSRNWPSARRFPLCFEFDGSLHVYSGKGAVDDTNDMWKFDAGNNLNLFGNHSNSLNNSLLATYLIFSLRCILFP